MTKVWFLWYEKSFYKLLEGKLSNRKVSRIHSLKIHYKWLVKKLKKKNALLVTSSVQSLSGVQLFLTPWTAAASLPCPSPTPRAYSDSWDNILTCRTAKIKTNCLYSLLVRNRHSHIPLRHLPIVASFWKSNLTVLSLNLSNNYSCIVGLCCV